MVSTRSGKQSGRLEEQRSRLREYLQQQIQLRLNEQENDFNYEPPTEARQFHVNHRHAHPGHYRNHDEDHRHRFNDDNPKTETVIAYRRRKPLF